MKKKCLKCPKWKTSNIKEERDRESERQEAA